MRISDWSSDVCSSDLRSTDYDGRFEIPTFEEILTLLAEVNRTRDKPVGVYPETKHPSYFASIGLPHEAPLLALLGRFGYRGRTAPVFIQRSEEHTSELQSLMRISYAVFCLKKKTK